MEFRRQLILKTKYNLFYAKGKVISIDHCIYIHVLAINCNDV